jgi:hypothetical protein
MKANLQVYVSPSVSVELRDKAKELGVSMSALADLFLRHGLASAKPEALAAWARTAARKPDAEDVKTRPSEALTLSCLTPEFRFSEEIRRETGQGRGVLWRSLQRLEHLGLAESEHKNSIKDALGRAMHSKWRLKPAPASGTPE